jgi:LysM repeat protein
MFRATFPGCRPLIASLLTLLCALSACGTRRDSPARQPAYPDSEQSQGAPLEAPPPVVENRMDGAPQAPAARPRTPPLPARDAPAPPEPAARPAQAPSAQTNLEPSYIVMQPGETISYISALYGVPEKDIIAWNGLASPGDVQAGQRIALRPPGTHSARAAPPSSGRASSPAPASPSDIAPDGTIVVAQGQSLSSLAARHGVSVSRLRAWNSLRSDTLRTGQRLRVRAPLAPADGALGESGEPAEESAAPRAPRKAPPDAPDAEGMITVRSGQSLSGIAAGYKTSVRELRRWNNLRGDRIAPGQKLRVQRVHTVKAGESLGGIAAKYGVGVKALMERNRLSAPDMLPEGKRLVIP